MADLRVIAAAVLREGRLLLVSKDAAPDVHYLPGGKPEPGESDEACLSREIAEELGCRVASAELFIQVRARAALEDVDMHMTVYLADLQGDPTPDAEIASMAWWPADRVVLAPAVRDVVIPRLLESGRLSWLDDAPRG